MSPSPRDSDQDHEPAQPSDYQRNWPLVARLERRLHAKMDAVIGNSRAVVRQLIEEGIPESKVRLIYNGIEVSPVLPDRNEARKALRPR